MQAEGGFGFIDYCNRPGFDQDNQFFASTWFCVNIDTVYLFSDADKGIGNDKYTTWHDATLQAKPFACWNDFNEDDFPTCKLNPSIATIAEPGIDSPFTFSSG